jgi:hypothetical protein
MTPFPLSRSDRNTRILITGFLLSMLVAIGVAELNNYDKVWRTKNGVVQRYGPEVEADPDAPLQPGDLVARMNTFSTLLDVTHPHAFEIPLVLFVLAHFLMRCRTPEWLKLASYLASSAGALFFIGSPWLVRYVTPRGAVFFHLGSALIGLSALVMIVVPLWDMWRPEPRSANGNGDGLGGLS